MKVVLATSFPKDPASPRGGVEAVSVNLAHALAEYDDLRITVVTADRDCSGPQITQWGRVAIHRIPRGGGSTLGNALREGRENLLTHLATIQPDLVHAHDTYGLMVRGYAGPRVFTVHGFIHADTRLSGENFAPLRAMLWRRYELAGWAEQPHIISISPYVRERLSGVAQGVIHDIENPIAAECFDVKRREQPGRVLYAGVIGRRKNALALVESFGRCVREGLPGELRLAGPDAEPDYAARVRARVEELGIADRVKFLGNLTSSQLRAEMAAASVFALVSLEEGAPMTIEEAMAIGVPVLASNRCGMPYMLRDGESGYLVDPASDEDIAWRLGQLLSDQNLRTHMGIVGRGIAEERFHPTVVARRTREVYRQAMAMEIRKRGTTLGRRAS
ncbi:MAG: glycosyltransferase family 4 protein [Planctomycetes bacterium]|nr:glycosyltransferase family 4 protein [Planctomycetota bacterium]